MLGLAQLFLAGGDKPTIEWASLRLQPPLLHCLMQHLINSRLPSPA